MRRLSTGVPRRCDRCELRMAESANIRCFGCAAPGDEGEMVEISGRRLCMDCKAAYEQKLREGVADDLHRKEVADVQNCPYCGEPVEHGFLRGNVSWSNTTRSLFPKLEAIGTKPKPGFFSMSISMEDTHPSFEAVRCHGCGLVMVTSEPKERKKE